MKADVIYGVNPVKEALRGNRRAFELFVQSSGSDQRISKLVAMAGANEVPVHRRERNDLEKIAGSQHHQGVVLLVAPFEYHNFDDFMNVPKQTEKKLFVLVLDGIQDPQNLGALIRTAACAGVDAVIIPKDRACGVTPSVEKVSAGAVETVKIIQVTNIVNTLEQLKNYGYWIFGLAGESDKDIYHADYTGNLAVVIGSEGSGIRSLVRKHCDLILSIPHYGGVASLNASVAGGIVLFEAARQRFL